MTLEITVRHHMSAGHRIPGLPGAGAKCANLHGHTFGIAWTFGVSTTEADIEFAETKRKLRGWVDTYLDHGFICGADDESLIDYLKNEGHKFYVLPVWPTTEAIVTELAKVALVDEELGPHLHSVTMTEGPHNEARWSR